MRIHAAAILYFDAVRRAGSIREAARRLNVASSAVNRQILKLEEEIGSPLFERRAQGVTLTAAGEMLARHVIVVLQDLERARSDIDALRGARAGHVSVAAVEGVCASLLPAVIARMRSLAPRVRVTASTCGSTAIPQVLEAGHADVGVAFSLPRSPQIRQAYMARFRMGAIMAPGHPLAGRATVGLAACCDHPLVWPGPGLSISGLLSPLLHALGRAVEPAVVSDSVDLTRQMAMRLPFVGFQTAIGLEAAIAEGKIVHVPLESQGAPVWSDLGIYVRAGRLLPATVDLFLQLLSTELQDQREEG